MNQLILGISIISSSSETSTSIRIENCIDNSNIWPLNPSRKTRKKSVRIATRYPPWTSWTSNQHIWSSSTWFVEVGNTSKCICPGSLRGVWSKNESGLAYYFKYNVTEYPFQIILLSTSTHSNPEGARGLTNQERPLCASFEPHTEFLLSDPSFVNTTHSGHYKSSILRDGTGPDYRLRPNRRERYSIINCSVPNGLYRLNLVLNNELCKVQLFRILNFSFLSG